MLSSLRSESPEIIGCFARSPTAAAATLAGGAAGPPPSSTALPGQNSVILARHLELINAYQQAAAAETETLRQAACFRSGEAGASGGIEQHVRVESAMGGQAQQ
jgi:hypothetical protein